MLSRDDSLAVILSVAIGLLVVTFAVVVSAFATPLPAAQDAPPDPSCLEWTDSCVVCVRTPTGQACSTPGIACTQTAPRCLRR
jgi:hypothetical protein